MINITDAFAPRPMNEVKEELLGRAKENRNPFLYTVFDEVAPVIEQLSSVNREDWAEAFSALAKRSELVIRI
jgi:hypothetical protein